MSWDRSPLDAVNVIRAQANGQVVLVLQGGGALGAYQGGVYEALHEAKVEPDWIIGTSIGAINAAIIAGNAVEHRLDRLREFWRRVERNAFWSVPPAWSGMVMNIVARFEEPGKLDLSDEGIRDLLSGNLCRCTGYLNIIAAVRRAAELLGRA